MTIQTRAALRIFPFSGGFPWYFLSCLFWLCQSLIFALPLTEVEKKLIDAQPSTTQALVGLDFGEQGFGSGIVVDKEGLILTAAHVTGGINRPLAIILSDGRRVRGITLGLDASNDAAMARITTPGEYDFVPLAEVTPHKGDWVFALGHSGGYEESRGPVVRLGKVIQYTDKALRTDSKLIGGDSGGPLFDLEGRLIGINSRVGLVLEDNVHVPIASFREEWDKLKSREWVAEGPFVTKHPGRIGATVDQTDEGLVLTELSPGATPLRENDILLKWNGQALTERKQLEDLLKESHAGREILLTIKRGAQQLEIPFILRTPPDELSLPLRRIPEVFDTADPQEQKGETEE